ncbi:DUF1672 family protein [Salipaludibacillus agaradhaerens]|jgi:hypothetical protein|uniref:DUF1672 family protein n=1 Tax=Salipaludibacillus agaradhaerens TaxID=76935 RepID=A0A9Q4AXJ4_SALAG|nr:DUF1672 domain-containing protein [Salipaludibacillus agaradhaerens]MCR6094986.1 DUF1672 family protein [Salipaludibacillus agaradhaerens]MCR6115456.1 DUF1672 family protein [Salipaludibacillus agaradhaerens]
MKKISVIGLGLMILVTGCMTMNKENNSNETDGDYTTGDAFDDRYVSVNDYTGEGYDLVNGEKTDVIANEKFAEIEDAMKAFFLEEYKTEVIVHNVVGNMDGATVFVESVGEPHFHTYAMIGIDVKEEKIMTESIWTQDSQVEQGIFSGLLAMIMDEEFAALDAFTDQIAEKYPVVGLRQEAINNVKATAYTTPYYFVQPMALQDEMEKMNRLYFENPSISAEELKSQFDKKAYNANFLRISIQVYMDEKDSKPTESLLDDIVQEFNGLEGIPRGKYSIWLHDNYVNKLSASGNQDSSLKERDIIIE